MFSPSFNIEKILSNISYEPQLSLLAQISKDEEDDKYIADRRRFLINNKWYIYVETPYVKTVVGPDYNYIFIKENGYFERWGHDISNDPNFSPLGPEILDLEISVDGCQNNCSFCYKNNTNKTPTNMSMETFINIIKKFPKVLTQIAFGITGIQTNPDFILMMKYCREIGIIPNFTLSGIDLTDDIAEECSKVAGAIAVSAYESDKNICYNTVKKFTDLGMNQINIHCMISNKTLDFTYQILSDIKSDPRLKKLNAIVFLSIKERGRASNGFKPLTDDEFSCLIKYCLDNNIKFGFDSCSAPKFENFILNDSSDETISQLIKYSESCESSLFSSYVNVHGEYWNCSFTEGNKKYKPINVLEIDDFYSDLWYSNKINKFRNDLLNNKRECPIFTSLHIKR